MKAFCVIFGADIAIHKLGICIGKYSTVSKYIKGDWIEHTVHLEISTRLETISDIS